jgi:small subunit ribosomal protein S21
MVVVKDNNIEKALRRFKKMVQDSGILDELRAKQEYVKPSITRRLKKNKAIRRAKKQRDLDIESGKIPAPNGQLKKRLY